MARRIGIIGGTFDPPHLGHLIIANEVCCRLGLDEVKFMPNHEPPHKSRKSGTTPEQRLEMLSLAIGGNSLFAIETAEIHKEGRSYTFDTMTRLVHDNPSADYHFIIGADMIEYLPNWYRIDDLFELIRFVGTNRPGYHMETAYPIIPVTVPFIEVSSSMIRKRLQAGETVKYYMPDEVIHYIERNKLYGSGEGT